MVSLRTALSFRTPPGFLARIRSCEPSRNSPPSLQLRRSFQLQSPSLLQWLPRLPQPFPARALPGLIVMREQQLPELCTFFYTLYSSIFFIHCTQADLFVIKPHFLHILCVTCLVCGGMSIDTSSLPSSLIGTKRGRLVLRTEEPSREGGTGTEPRCAYGCAAHAGAGTELRAVGPLNRGAEPRGWY